jgi:hypothetical protein
MDGEDQNWLESYFSAGDDAPAVDETAIEAAAPEADTPPVAEDGDAEPLDDAPTDADPVAFDEASPEPEPLPTGPAPIDWNHPELQPIRQQAERMQGLEAQLAQLSRQKAATDFQNELAELADGDPERLQQINGIVARVAAPAVQHAQAAEQQANATAKALTALWVAAQANLSDDQVALLKAETDALMGVEGPELMQRTAFGKRDFMRQTQAERQADKKRIAELELQVASQTQLTQREAAGADLVDGGGGTVSSDLSREDRMRTAQSMDDYWLAMTGRGANP